ncbi:hypothetical protein LP420_34495 [Massilia sp. B-10]|nr:hypothetical protein LP420_34495 [Massilia sp. B-10]
MPCRTPSIAAWDAKRYYDSVRPITAVRWQLCCQVVRGYGPGGPAAGLSQISGALWTPYQLPSNPTLPFPDHVSGHSTFSAASAEVLKRFTGSDAFKHSVSIAAGSLLLEPALLMAAVTLRWDTFSAAACEAGVSRVYLKPAFPAGRSGRTRWAARWARSPSRKHSAIGMAAQPDAPRAQRKCRLHDCRRHCSLGKPVTGRSRSTRKRRYRSGPTPDAPCRARHACIAPARSAAC